MYVCLCVLYRKLKRGGSVTTEVVGVRKVARLALKFYARAGL